MNELNMKQMAMAAGGRWTFDTLTEEEREEYRALDDLWQELEFAGRWDEQNGVEKKINNFITRMNLKYNRI